MERQQRKRSVFLGLRSKRANVLEKRIKHLADGKLRVVSFSHGVIDEDGHQLSDLVQIVGPRLLKQNQK